MATRNLKHKRVVLSLENKLTRLAQGEMMTNLAKEYSVGYSTLTDLKKNESKIFFRLAKDGQLDEVYSKTQSRNPSYGANNGIKSPDVLSTASCG